MPSACPTSVPSGEPSGVPSSAPAVPTSMPTQPSSVPTGQPTVDPSAFPSTNPTSVPSALPSCRPSLIPSGNPTETPSNEPSSYPSMCPTSLPSSLPSPILTVAPSRHPTAVPTVRPTRVPTTAAPTKFLDTVDLSEPCFDTCSYPGSTKNPSQWGLSELCEFYDSTKCSATNISKYACVPACLYECGNVFCNSFSRLSFLCAQPKLEVDYGKASAMEGKCLNSFAEVISTETLVEFNISIVFENITAEEFLNDTKAQNATEYVVAFTMPQVKIYQVFIMGVRNYIALSDEKPMFQYLHQDRMAVSVDLIGSAVEVVLNVQVIVELLGYASTDALVAYVDLKTSAISAYVSKQILRRLQAEGLLVFGTDLFERDFDAIDILFSPASISYLRTAVPTLQPTESPTFKTAESSQTQVGGFNLFYILAAVGFVITCCLLWCVFFCFRKKSGDKYAISQVGIAPDEEIDELDFIAPVKKTREELFEVFTPQKEHHASLKYKPVFDVSISSLNRKPGPSALEDFSFTPGRVILPPIIRGHAQPDFSPLGPRLEPIEKRVDSPMSLQKKRRKRTRRPPENDRPAFIESDTGAVPRTLSIRGGTIRVPPGGGYISDVDIETAHPPLENYPVFEDAPPLVTSPSSRRKSGRSGSAKSPNKMRSIRIPPGGGYTSGPDVDRKESSSPLLFDRKESGANVSNEEKDYRDDDEKLRLPSLSSRKSEDALETDKFIESDLDAAINDASTDRPPAPFDHQGNADGINIEEEEQRVSNSIKKPISDVASGSRKQHPMSGRPVSPSSKFSRKIFSERLPPGGGYNNGLDAAEAWNENSQDERHKALIVVENAEKEKEAYETMNLPTQSPQRQSKFNNDQFIAGPAQLFDQVKKSTNEIEGIKDRQDGLKKIRSNELLIPKYFGDVEDERGENAYKRSHAPSSRAVSAKVPSVSSPAAPRGHRAMSRSRQRAGPAPDEEDITNYAQSGALGTRKQQLWGGSAAAGSPLQHPFGGRRAVSHKQSRVSGPGQSQKYSSDEDD